MRTGRTTKDGETRHYVLAELAMCGVCGRRMDAHWVHGRPGYRCRHGYSSAMPRPADAPRNVYVREDRLLEVLPGLLADSDNTRSGLVGGGPTSDPVEVLRLRRLQIVCTHQGQELWREAPRVISSVPSPQGQTALALDLDHERRHGVCWRAIANAAPAMSEFSYGGDRTGPVYAGTSPTR